MEKELIDYVSARVDILAASDLSTDVTRDAAIAWKDDVAEDESNADEATVALLDILEGRPTTIDGLIEFLEGPSKDIYGEEATNMMLAEQLQRKEDGAKFCNCEACNAAAELLDKFGRVEM